MESVTRHEARQVPSWLIFDVRQVMTKRILVRVLVYVAIAYSALWVLTFVHAPILLQRQVLQRMSVEAEKIRRGIAEDPGSFASQQLAKRTAGGPMTAVELLRCPAPFWFEARVRQSVGDFMQSGGDRWYFYTPWNVYILVSPIKA